MDTRLRNNDGTYDEPVYGLDKPEYAKALEDAARPRRGRVRGIALLLALLLWITLLFISCCCLAYYSRQEEYTTSNNNDKILEYSWEIPDAVARYAQNLHRYYVHFGGPEFYRSLEQRVTAEHIEDLKVSQMQTLENELRQLLELQENYEQDEDTIKALYNRLYDSMILTDEELLVSAMDEMEQNYAEVEAYVHNTRGLGYIITDVRTGSTHSNMENVHTMEVAARYASDNTPGPQYYAVLPLDHSIFRNFHFTGVPLPEAFARDHMKGYIFLIRSDPPDELDRYWAQAEAAVAAHAFRDYSRGYYALLLAACSLLLGTAWLILRDKRAASQALAFAYALYARLPLVIKAGGVLFAIAILAHFIQWPPDIIQNMVEYGNDDTLLYISLLMGLFVVLALGIWHVINLARRTASLTDELETKLARMFWSDIRDVIRASDPGIWLVYSIAALLVLGASFMVLYTAGYGFGVGALMLSLATVAGAAMAHHFLCAQARLVYYIKQMAAGDISDVPYRKGIFSKSQRLLCSVSEGVNHAVAEQIRSERLKSELITNVSHDLRTPLTSIINYVSLLKELPPQSAEAASYLDILERKSERLGALIEDLFEASKLQSGNVDLTRERLDIVGLIRQAMGELDEKIAASGISFRFSHTPEHIYCYCDGKKMWRAFDNLITNIIKYAQPGSRAYIDATQNEHEIRLMFKNMSAYELNIDPRELFNRFKRGDQARTTEGSGLGLAIARGIIELHGGKVEIEIDGDLFKVGVVLRTADA